jgi:hypothetical protein
MENLLSRICENLIDRVGGHENILAYAGQVRQIHAKPRVTYDIERYFLTGYFQGCFPG